MFFFKEKNGLTKNIWAEKSPRNCYSYEDLEHQNENLHFISMVRDGRDVVTSRLGNSDIFHCDVDRYIQTMGLVLNFRRDNHLVVKYEDMVSDPLNTFQGLSEWIGIPFKKECVTEYANRVSTRDTDQHQQDLLNKPVSTSQICRWKSPEFESRVAEFMKNDRAVELLQESGYINL